MISLARTLKSGVVKPSMIWPCMVLTWAVACSSSRDDGGSAGHGGGNVSEDGGQSGGEVAGSTGTSTGGRGGSGGQTSGGGSGARLDAGQNMANDGGVRVDAGVGADAAAMGQDANTPVFAPCSSMGPCRVLPFGDSITAGWGSKLEGGYREELFRLFRAANESATFVGTLDSGPETLDGAPFPTANEGHAGWGVAHHKDAQHEISGITEIVESSFAQSKPEIVLLHIWTNDLWFPIPHQVVNDRLEILIDLIEKNAPKALIFVAEIIPMWGTPPFNDGHSPEVKAYNAAIRAMVKRRQARGEPIQAVDMWTAFISNKNYAAITGDGVHPNDGGYKVMASTWHAAIAPYLKRR